MIEIIKNIFEISGFKSQETSSFILFFFEDKTSYWIVKEVETLDFLEEQDELFDSAKKIAEHDPVFDKNASLLLIQKVSSDTNLNDFKKEILEIEEDPYQFKKQVLIYSESVKDELDEQLLNYGFTELLVNQNTFKQYKENYPESTWHTLLYRIAQKLPFVPINIEKNKNLSSLFKTNQTAIVAKGFDEINTKITNGFETKLADDIKSMDSETVFNLLLTDEEKVDGIENK
jgi:hypothetical protein